MADKTRKLLDPLETEYPDLIEHQLKQNHATCCAFNRRGTLLASGCTNGIIVLWDFETYSIAKLLDGNLHVAISSISWSRNGRYILSCNKRSQLQLWDVDNSKLLITLSMLKEEEELFSFHSVSLHPNDHYKWIGTQVNNSRRAEIAVINLKKNDTQEFTYLKHVLVSNKLKQNNKEAIAVYDKRGSMIVVGSSNNITVYDSSTYKVINEINDSGMTRIRNITFSRDNAYFLVTTFDRLLLFNTSSFNKQKEYTEIVNRYVWTSAAFSSNAEFIIAVPETTNASSVFVWDRVYGELLKILEGPKDTVLQMLYHPSRPIIVTCGTSGTLYVWAKSYLENWSAFAPDFEQLDENVEYIEREDEFDLIVDNKKNKEKSNNNIDDKNDNEPCNVDLFTINDSDEFSECDDELIHLPVIPHTSFDSNSTNATKENGIKYNNNDITKVDNNDNHNSNDKFTPPPLKKQKTEFL